LYEGVDFYTNLYSRCQTQPDAIISYLNSGKYNPTGAPLAQS